MTAPTAPPVVIPELPLERLQGGRLKPIHVERLHRLGIDTVGELLRHVPRRYEDTRALVPLAELQPGMTQTALVRVFNVRTRVTGKQHLVVVEADLEDATGAARAIWFNKKFRFTLKSGSTYYMSGRIRMDFGGPQFQNPSYELARNAQLHVGRLAPVYPETDKINSRDIRALVERVIDAADRMPDPIPPEIRQREHLLDLGTTLRQLHFPDSPEAADRAQERMAFEEIFLLQVAAERARRRRLRARGVMVPYDVAVARAFSASLPFKLTDGQRVAGHEILTDMAKTGPMNRLLQGDVGSGKTVVAALAALMTQRAGMQTAVMAPTEILARQHAHTLDLLLSPHGLPPHLLVGSTPARARREVLAALAAGHASLIVGTHALIEEDVVMERLGLVVVDEQHRFGVAQRQRLRQKSGEMPNFLAMTATPIPRSLALTLYGDVDVSELREMPPGRTPVETRVVAPEARSEAYAFVRAQLEAGRQAFVICPIIEESDKLGVRSATAEHERLSTRVFPELRVDLLHGRLPAREKEERMRRFAAGEIDVLVATSVVEVGVDVPNASVMLIEGAERFGLAQLHQFRGRVGRGAHRSHCLLFQGSVDEAGAKRLHAVAASTSGFELADLDLQLRGAGDVVGLRQHGLPEMRAADLLDVALMARARQAAAAWLDRDPGLMQHAQLRQVLDTYRAVFDLD